MTPENDDNTEEASSLHSLVSSTGGITVAQLKQLIKDWPETDAYGEPTEVWIGTGPMLISPCTEIWPLNLREVGGGARDGERTSDILLEPNSRTWGERE